MKKAKLFKNGQSQAVRLPKEFRFEGGEVYIQRDGNSVILMPIKELRGAQELYTTFFNSLFRCEWGLRVTQDTSPTRGEGANYR